MDPNEVGQHITINLGTFPCAYDDGQGCHPQIAAIDNNERLACCPTEYL